VIRCPRCGTRLHESTPTCPRHGVVAVPSGPPEKPHDTDPHRHAVVSDERIKALSALGYEVSHELGRGGFGLVMQGSRIRDGQMVAIKVALHDSAAGARTIEREAALLKRIGPPHVPALLEQGFVLEQPFLVLELLSIPSLADVLVQAAGPVLTATFVPIARALLTGVEALHARGVVHRDLKPENLFLADDGGVRIIDFGHAIDKQEGPQRGDGDVPGDVGTAEYMSPEQCDGRSDLDLRTDIYSLGVLFYELLAGAPPFWSRAGDVREAQRSERPPPLRLEHGATPLLADLIRRCLAKDREQRFHDVPALREAFELALRDTSASSDSMRRAHELPEARAPRAAREKRTVGLIFFESQAGLGSVQAWLSRGGGQIVHSKGTQYVCAFGHDAADNPARLALSAAQRLISARLCTRAIVDVAAVFVQARPDGTRRLVSTIFEKKERFPTSAEPAEAMLTRSAVDALGDVLTIAVADRADRFLIAPSTFNTSSMAFSMRPAATLVGRDEELKLLTGSARCALTRTEPTAAIVVGEPGYGRSHLAASLASQIEQISPSFDVIRLASQEGMIGSISQTLPELLRRSLDLPAEAPVDSGQKLLTEALATDLGRISWAAAAFTLSWIDADHPEILRLAAAPGALRLASARAVGEALRIRARERPVAVLLDDAHLADDATLDALEYATLREAPGRIWVCAFVRPSFERTRATWGSRAAHHPKVCLEPLDPTRSKELLRLLLLPVEYVPPEALNRLVERTRGEPRLMVELVRGLKRDGLVRRIERGTGFYLATDAVDRLPDVPLFQWNVSREIEALPVQLAGHARLCAVLGSSFVLGEVEALEEIVERTEQHADVLLDAKVGLQRLTEATLLVRRGRGVYTFRHPLLRDTLYELIPETQRKALHEAAFEMYRTLALPQDQHLPKFALHAARCGHREEARSAYMALAQGAQKRHAYLTAEAAFSFAIDNFSERPEISQVDALRGRGLMRFRLGRHEDAIKDLESAQERARALHDVEREVESMLDEALVRDWIFDYAQANALSERANELGQGASGLLAVRMRAARAHAHRRKSEDTACVALGTEVAADALSFGDEAYETRADVLTTIAPLCANLGRFAEAERHFDALITDTQAHGDLLQLGAVYVNRSLLWFALKDVRRLYEDLERASEIASEVGAPQLAYAAISNMAEAKYAMGELDAAAAHARRSLELAALQWGADSLEVGNRELLLARIALYRGDLLEAARLAALARSRIPRGNAEGVAGDFSASDHLLLRMVELNADDGHESAWDELLEQLQAVETQPLEEVEIIESRALFAFRKGRTNECRVWFSRALEVSQRKPNLLSDRVQRRLEELFPVQD